MMGGMEFRLDFSGDLGHPWDVSIATAPYGGQISRFSLYEKSYERISIKFCGTGGNWSMNK